MRTVRLDDMLLEEFIRFLEWLDVSREVTAWGNPEESHEDTAKKYLEATRTDDPSP